MSCKRLAAFLVLCLALFQSMLVYSHELKPLMRKANMGEPRAQYELALHYRLGKELPKDMMLALKWCERAARQNHIEAQKTLAAMYSEHDGTPVDYPTALKWYRKAARSGDHQAQIIVADWLLEGKGTNPDPKKSLQWYLKASEYKHANPKVFYMLGQLFSLGKGIEQNLTMAASWFEKSATMGHVDSQMRLAYLYSKGIGVQRDFTRSAHWYHLAALHDNPKAQYRYGSMLAKGKGLEKDLALAYAWLVRASEQGSKLSDLMAAKIKRKLSDEQRQSAIDYVYSQLNENMIHG